MEKTIKQQKRIITILSAMLIVTISYLAYWVNYERNNLKGNIAELEQGAQIDYRYINKLNDLNKSVYSIWESCNTILSKDLKQEIPDNELLGLFGDYMKKVDTVEDISKDIESLKVSRSEEFSKFKYVKILKSN
jgi:Fe-S oxidoreductase